MSLERPKAAQNFPPEKRAGLLSFSKIEEQKAVIREMVELYRSGARTDEIASLLRVKEAQVYNFIFGRRALS